MAPLPDPFQVITVGTAEEAPPLTTMEKIDLQVPSPANAVVHVDPASNGVMRPVLHSNTEVDKHTQPNAIQSNGLSAVREKKRARLEVDVQRVTFNPTVTGVEIDSIYDLTPTEIAALWYNPEEMDRIVKRCVGILNRMEAGDDKRYCIRGLEGHTPLGSKSRKRNRHDAMAAVRIVQAQQRVENRFDDQAIAVAYQRAASSCQMRAQIMGKRDQETAESIHYANGNHHEAKPSRTKTTSQDELALPSSHNVVLDRWGSSPSFTTRTT